ncbi:hypothetical protein JTB14_011975 [Gonioctena quinquepunctata]|nr:hypothetical protein JTB14_011975 [Gonioctena quinquepunctata]
MACQKLAENKTPGPVYKPPGIMRVMAVENWNTYWLSTITWPAVLTKNNCHSQPHDSEAAKVEPRKVWALVVEPHLGYTKRAITSPKHSQAKENMFF